MAESKINTPTTLAQTHMQGPLSVNGSGKPLSRDELEAYKQELAEIKSKYGYEEPIRSFMEDKDIEWRFGGPPDYSLTNLFYLKERSKKHAPGSLEQVVENLVKTWEMERSHKLDPAQHRCVDQENFVISANGGKRFSHLEAQHVGNYNVLLNACPAELWDSEKITWEDSHQKFHTAFAAFPWEVLDVYSPPPKVAFTWRHWAYFKGTYEGRQGKGELVEMFGFGTAIVNDKLQLVDVDVYYDAEGFINVLRGIKTPDQVNHNWKAGACPYHERTHGGKKSN